MWFERLVFTTIILSVTQSALDTVPVIGSETHWQQVFFGIETVFVLFFTIEYILRLVASPELPAFRGTTNVALARLHYVLSFYSLVDLCAILPYYIARFVPSVDEYDHTFRLLRVLRLLSLDKYYPGMSLMDDVIRRASDDLTVAAFVAGVTWVIFTALLYLCEHDSTTEDADREMGQRFADMPSSFSYTLILLSGMSCGVSLYSKCV